MVTIDKLTFVKIKVNYEQKNKQTTPYVIRGVDLLFYCPLLIKLYSYYNMFEIKNN